MEHFDFVIIVKMDDVVAEKVNRNRCCFEQNMPGISIPGIDNCELNNNNGYIHSQVKSRVFCVKDVFVGKKVKIIAGEESSPIAETSFVIPDPIKKEYGMVCLKSNGNG